MSGPGSMPWAQLSRAHNNNEGVNFTGVANFWLGPNGVKKKGPEVGGGESSCSQKAISISCRIMAHNKFVKHVHCRISRSADARNHLSR